MVGFIKKLVACITWSEGTKSVIIGIHNPIHSYYVWKAWKILYNKYPTWKELLCIIVHDIGYIGRNYYTESSNSGHVLLGGKLIDILLGHSYGDLVRGHSLSYCKENNIEPSLMERPDEYSWLIANKKWVTYAMKIEKFNSTYEGWISVVRANFELGESGGMKETGTVLGKRLNKK